jgi:hypothetical protein
VEEDKKRCLMPSCSWDGLWEVGQWWKSVSTSDRRLLRTLESVVSGDLEGQREKWDQRRTVWCHNTRQFNFLYCILLKFSETNQLQDNKNPLSVAIKVWHASITTAAYYSLLYVCMLIICLPYYFAWDTCDLVSYFKPWFCLVDKSNKAKSRISLYSEGLASQAREAIDSCINLTMQWTEIKQVQNMFWLSKLSSSW